MKLAYFTICSRNYLAYALTLRDSLLAAEPRAAFHVFLADEPVEGGDPCAGIIPASALALPDYWDMAFRYTVMEFNTAIKPFCFDYLFDALGYDGAVYLDPDILVLKPLAKVAAALRDGADAALTPHITAPLEDGFSPDDLDILRSGAFNLGFAAFANRGQARAFIAWWGRRCARDCVVDLASGRFVDQKFVDLAPSFVERTTILRDPGLNAAYWNLKHRPVARAEGGEWTAAGAPLVFFHFSGVAPGDPSVFSRHQNRYGAGDIGALRDLLADYLARLAANGHARWRDIPYAYDRYTDGTRIPAEARRLYARGALTKEKGREGLFAPDHDALNAPSPAADQDKNAPITVFMNEIWRGRPDLQAQFPLSCAAGRRAFHRWFIRNAAREHAAGPSHLAAAQAGGARPGLVELAARALYQRLPKGLRAAARENFFSTSDRSKK